MKKLWISILWLWIFLAWNNIFAAWTWEQLTGETTAQELTGVLAQVDSLSKKLENYKSELIKETDTSKKKLQSIAKQTVWITDTSLYKAATCLWAVSTEDKDLDYDKLINKTKGDFLTDYISLDWDIKRLEFGLSGLDPIVLENNIDSFYNKNSAKIADLETDYYVNVKELKNDFLEYLGNNKEILNKLAQNLDFVAEIIDTTNNITDLFEEFTDALNDESDFLDNLNKSREEYEKSFEEQIDTIMAEAIEKYNPSSDLQAKYLIHKDNFIKKYNLEAKKAQYYIFSALFSYDDYQLILDKKALVEKQFEIKDWTPNCSLLLTTNVNLGSYAQEVKTKAEKLERGLNVLTNAIYDGRLHIEFLEEPAISHFNENIETLTKRLTKNYRLMLDSETPQATETNTGSATEETNPQTETTPVNNVTFTQAFKKGTYNEEIKTLQTILKNWWYYEGEINWVYDNATIEAVYKFQLKEWVITWKETNKSWYWWFGPATRAKLNSLIS